MWFEYSGEQYNLNAAYHCRSDNEYLTINFPDGFQLRITIENNQELVVKILRAIKLQRI